MPADDFVQCLTEVPGQIPTTKLFARGDFNSPKQDIAPAELTVLNTRGFTIASDDPQLPTSGRRLAYARHLTDGQHPLVARVLVNRFWMHHFGRGLVATPADFGVLGQPPSHPALLDWLADDFMAGGWKLKRLQRMIVTSTAYRQSSQHRAELDAVDPENRLLGRMSIRRLEAEMLRDALLASSGRLSAKMFGPPVPVTPDDVGQIVVGVDTRDSAGRPTGKVVDLGEDEFRRSIYVQVQRSKPLGMLETFDAPAMSPNCELRASSTNAPQSLLLMNNTFVLQQADAMAQRIEKEVGGDPAAQFQRAWQLAYLSRAVREPVAGRRGVPRRTICDHRCQRASQSKSRAAQIGARRVVESVSGPRHFERLPLRGIGHGNTALHSSPLSLAASLRAGRSRAKLAAAAGLRPGITNQRRQRADVV